MPVKVYIWKMEGAKVGHASMSLSDNTHISWWPDQGVPIKQPDGSWKLSTRAIENMTLQRDIDYEGSVPEEFTISMTYEDELKIQKWWKNFRSSNSIYDIVKMNCSTVVYKALCAAYPALHLFVIIPVWVPPAIMYLVNAPRKDQRRFDDFDWGKMFQDFKTNIIPIATQFLAALGQYSYVQKGISQ